MAEDLPVERHPPRRNLSSQCCIMAQDITEQSHARRDFQSWSGKLSVIKRPQRRARAADTGDPFPCAHPSPCVKAAPIRPILRGHQDRSPEDSTRGAPICDDL